MSGQVNIYYDDGHHHSSVNVAGEFTNWEQVPLGVHSGTKYAAVFEGAEAGKAYMYKFVVDKQWQLLSSYPTVNDSAGNLNHSVKATSATSASGTGSRDHDSSADKSTTSSGYPHADSTALGAGGFNLGSLGGSSYGSSNQSGYGTKDVNTHSNAANASAYGSSGSNQPAYGGTAINPNSYTSTSANTHSGASDPTFYETSEATSTRHDPSSTHGHSGTQSSKDSTSRGVGELRGSDLSGPGIAPHSLYTSTGAHNTDSSTSAYGAGNANYGSANTVPSTYGSTYENPSTSGYSGAKSSNYGTDSTSRDTYGLGEQQAPHHSSDKSTTGYGSSYGSGYGSASGYDSASGYGSGSDAHKSSGLNDSSVLGGSGSGNHSSERALNGQDSAPQGYSKSYTGTGPTGVQHYIETNKIYTNDKAGGHPTSVEATKLVSADKSGNIATTNVLSSTSVQHSDSAAQSHSQYGGATRSSDNADGTYEYKARDLDHAKEKVSGLENIRSSIPEETKSTKEPYEYVANDLTKPTEEVKGLDKLNLGGASSTANSGTAKSEPISTPYEYKGNQLSHDVEKVDGLDQVRDTSAGQHSSGQSGSGYTGSGLTGSGLTGSGNTGSGNTGSGYTGSGLTGSGLTGSGLTGSGLTGSGNTGSGYTGSGLTGSGYTGSGNTGLDRSLDTDKTSHIPANSQIPGSLPYESKLTGDLPPENVTSSTLGALGSKQGDSSKLSETLDPYAKESSHITSDKLAGTASGLGDKTLDGKSGGDKLGPSAFNKESTVSKEYASDAKDLHGAKDAYSTSESSGIRQVDTSFANRSSNAHSSNVSSPSALSAHGAISGSSSSSKPHQPVDIHSGFAADESTEYPSPSSSSRSHRHTLGGVPTLRSENKRSVGSSKGSVLGQGTTSQESRNSAVVAAATKASAFAKQDVANISNPPQQAGEAGVPSDYKPNKTPTLPKSSSPSRRPLSGQYSASTGLGSGSTGAGAGAGLGRSGSTAVSHGDLATRSSFERQRPQEIQQQFEPKKQSKLKRILSKLGGHK